MVLMPGRAWGSRKHLLASKSMPNMRTRRALGAGRTMRWCSPVASAMLGTAPSSSGLAAMVDTFLSTSGAGNRKTQAADRCRSEISKAPGDVAIMGATLPPKPETLAAIDRDARARWPGVAFDREAFLRDV